MAVAIPLIGLAIGLGTTAYSVYEGERQADRAKDAMRDQEKAQLAMQQEYQQRQAQQDQQAAMQQQTAMARQRAIASGYQNAAGATNFTSPLGLPGAANTAKTSLLGL